MLLKDFIPSLPVREFVQLYRIVHLVFEPGVTVPFKAYPPRPEQCIAFYPFDREKVVYAGSGKKVEGLPVVLYGQPLEVTNRHIGNNFLVFQIVFLPGALYRLTGIPATAITNQYLDASLVFSNSVHEVNEQLYAANSYEKMIAVAENFILTLIKKHRRQASRTDIVCRNLLYQPDHITLDALAKQSCYSGKQLERKIKESTGVGPKLFNRIIRFDKAFRLKNSKPQLDWLRIAVACNYHDYQHLSKEYKQFTGLSPVAFHTIEDKAPERNFGLSEGYYSGGAE